MEPITLQLKGHEVKVSELPLKKYTELLSSFQELPKHLDKIQGKSGDEILAELPFLITNCYGDAVRVIKLVSNLDEETIDNLGLYDVVEIFTAAYKVNRLNEMFSNAKKMTAQPTM